MVVAKVAASIGFPERDSAATFQLCKDGAGINVKLTPSLMKHGGRHCRGAGREDSIRKFVRLVHRVQLASKAPIRRSNCM
jgi:hypothetical protein